MGSKWKKRSINRKQYMETQIKRGRQKLLDLCSTYYIRPSYVNLYRYLEFDDDESEGTLNVGLLNQEQGQHGSANWLIEECDKYGIPDPDAMPETITIHVMPDYINDGENLPWDILDDLIVFKCSLPECLKCGNNIKSHYISIEKDYKEMMRQTNEQF